MRGEASTRVTFRTLCKHICTTYSTHTACKTSTIGHHSYVQGAFLCQGTHKSFAILTVAFYLYLDFTPFNMQTSRV